MLSNHKSTILTTNSRPNLYVRSAWTVQNGRLGAGAVGPVVEHEARVVPRPRHEAEVALQEAELLARHVRVGLSPAATAVGVM